MTTCTRDDSLIGHHVLAELFQDWKLRYIVTHARIQALCKETPYIYCSLSLRRDPIKHRKLKQ